MSTTTEVNETLLPERIANLALSTFDKLPKKCKPRVHPDGRREWTPMSAVVLVSEQEGNKEKDEAVQLKCVSLATGTKCLSASLLKDCKGMVLHDCHAEILALRGFNRWLLSEIRTVLENDDDGNHASFVSLIEPSLQDTKALLNDPDKSISRPLFRINPNVSIYLFSTTAPCGDASMELLISSKSPSQAVPWPTSDLPSDPCTDQIPLGRGHFSILGAMRRKPARADAEATLSKSCTDKMALKQITGLVSFPGNTLVDGNAAAFLKGVVVYHDEYSQVGYSRAFGREGRLKSCSKAGASMSHFFETCVLPTTCKRFQFARSAGKNAKVTNISALWIAGSDSQDAIIEVLVNGVKQGFRQFDEREGKASVVSRKRMLDEYAKLRQLLSRSSHMDRPDFHSQATSCSTYGQMKRLLRPESMTARKQDIVRKLGGWSSKTDEDNFAIPEIIP